MKIVNDFSGDYTLGLTPYINKSFENINDEEDLIIFNGFHTLENRPLLNRYTDAKRRCLINVWSPCEFAQPFNMEAYRYFTEVYCVCKYTCKIANKYFQEEKFIYFPFAFTNYSSTHNDTKEHDVCYFGGIHVPEQDKALFALKKFNHQFFSFGPHGSHATSANKIISTEDKLKAVSKCKISLCYNWISVENKHKKNLSANGFNHPAFYGSHGSHIAPQFKVRVHESASCGSLILCRKDEWKLIEDFYTENKEFVYFENEDELPEKIKDITENWDKYKTIAQNGYKRSQQYTIENFYPFMKTKDKSLITWECKDV
jgi:hypothetical protein